MPNRGREDWVGVIAPKGRENPFPEGEQPIPGEEGGCSGMEGMERTGREWEGIWKTMEDGNGIGIDDSGNGR
jgi:hypothetical protein